MSWSSPITPSATQIATALGYTPANLIGTQGLLWSLTGANMNVTTDQALTKAFTFTNYTIDKILVTNASTSLTLAAGGIYTASAKGGTAIVAAGQVYSALTTAVKTLNLTINNTDFQSGASLILSLTTGQGSAATADIRVIGTAWS